MKSFGVRVYKEYFNFAASHFLIFEDGSREELHGHNYQVRVQVRGEIGPGDMVLDFCQLKPLVKRCCDALDHRMLLPERHDRLELSEADGHVEARFRRPDAQVERYVFPRRDVILLPIRNTSTERLAEYLAGQVLAALEKVPEYERLRRFEIEVEEAGGQCGIFVVDPVQG